MSALERLLSSGVRWQQTLCGACGVRYRTCAICGIGMKGNHREFGAFQCANSHDNDNPCSPNCLAILAAQEAERTPDAGWQRLAEAVDIYLAELNDAGNNWAERVRLAKDRLATLACIWRKALPSSPKAAEKPPQ